MDWRERTAGEFAFQLFHVFMMRLTVIKDRNIGTKGYGSLNLSGYYKDNYRKESSMKNVVLALLVTGLTFAGCGGKEAPPAPAANPTPQPAAGMPSLAATAEASPPPGAPAAIAAPGAAPEVPTYEGKDEAEKLTKALHDYYERGGAETPLITSLDALVKAGYLKSVPVPPAGKKYVVTTQYPFQVRLESK